MRAIVAPGAEAPGRGESGSPAARRWPPVRPRAPRAGVRRWRGARLHAARRRRAAAARRATAAAGPAPHRPAHDARPAPQAGVAARRSPTLRARPRRQHRRQPRPTATRCPRARRARRRCSTCPGVFVLGSNDYYAPTRNPLRYLLPDDGRRNTEPPAALAAICSAGSSAAGWLDLTNRRAASRSAGRRSRSPASTTRTCSYDDLTRWPGPADAAADVRLGVTHAPYLRVLDQFAHDGAGLATLSW